MKSTFFYGPNILNYTRLVLVLSTTCLQGFYFIVLYSISSLLDIIDGEFARGFAQTSVLGACLDLFTDRIGTCIIIFRILELIHILKFCEQHAKGVGEKDENLRRRRKEDKISNTCFIQQIVKHEEMILNSLWCNQLTYPMFAIFPGNGMFFNILKPSFLLFYLCIDILSSNFLFTAFRIRNTTHKKGHISFILANYYRQPVFLLLCASKEVFFVTLYTYLYLRLNARYSDESTKSNQKHSFIESCENIMYFTFPFCMARLLFNVVQFIEGIVQLGRIIWINKTLKSSFFQ